MSQPIRAENVTVTFGEVRAVDDVSFTTEPGEMFFLLGPSGCGKTTLLRAVAGLGSVDAGRLFIGQRDITNVPPYRRGAAMVFQNYALWPHMTVLQNVTFALELRRVDRRERRRRGLAALEVVQMGRYAERKPNQLSGGQQQRVALARALAAEPACLLLDEPLSNLDAKLRLEMRDELRRIHRETGLTVLYVTHDQKEALSLADRVALMRDGRIVQTGSPRELYQQPASRFAAAFLGEANFLAGRLARVADGLAEVETAGGTVAARPGQGADLAGGAACEIVVRPESIVLRLDEEPAPPNALEGEVVDATFLGETEQVTLHVAGQGEIKAVGVPQPGRPWRRGQAVRVGFDPQVASVFATETSTKGSGT